MSQATIRLESYRNMMVATLYYVRQKFRYSRANFSDVLKSSYEVGRYLLESSSNFFGCISRIAVGIFSRKARLKIYVIKLNRWNAVAGNVSK